MSYISDFLTDACYYDIYLKDGCTSKRCSFKHFSKSIRNALVSTFIKFIIPDLALHTNSVLKQLKLKHMKVKYGVCIHQLVNGCNKQTIGVNLMYKGKHMIVKGCYTEKRGILYCSLHLDFLYEKTEIGIKFKDLIPFGERNFVENVEFPPILTDKCDETLVKPIAKPVVKWGSGKLRKTSFVPDADDLIDMKNLILSNKIKSVKDQLKTELEHNKSLDQEIKDLKQKISDYLLEKNMVYLKPRYKTEQKCISCGLGVKEVLCKYCVEEPYSDEYSGYDEEEIYYSDEE